MEHVRRLALTTTGLMLATVLAGCSNAGSTTCADYGDLTYDEREELLADLLVEHRLEPVHVGNTVGVLYAVDQFCGTMTSVLTDDRPATKNLDRPLDESHDWDSPTWDTPFG